MLFQTLPFAIFLGFLFLLFWTVPFKFRSPLILVASYFFFGFWDWRFLFLLFGSSIVDFIIAQRIFGCSGVKRKRALLFVSLFCNLGALFVFKYFGFFIESFNLFAERIFPGLEFELPIYNLILPIGISFYTFQTLGYTVDVYNGRIPAEKNLVKFLSFVSFFPQLVAGPIERAKDLLPQMKFTSSFESGLARGGVVQIGIGLFKKVVVADGIALAINPVFADPTSYGGLTLLAAIVLFSFQIYCDFSGYSDMAVGIASLFGVRLSQNFLTPYFSTNILEFWRRWHVTLSNWFRDYIYIPLGGSRCGSGRTVVNLFVVFFISGLWHGASWNFVFWGISHGLACIVCFFLIPVLDRIYGNRLARMRATLGVFITFAFVTFSWVLFRTTDLGHFQEYSTGVFSGSLNTGEAVQFLRNNGFVLVFVLILLVIDFSKWSNRAVETWPLPVRWTLYYILLAAILFFGLGAKSDFIYFQF